MPQLRWARPKQPPDSSVLTSVEAAGSSSSLRGPSFPVGQGEAPHALLGCKASTLQKAYLRCVVVMGAHSPQTTSRLGSGHCTSTFQPPLPSHWRPCPAVMWRTLGRRPTKESQAANWDSTPRPWRSQPPAGNSFLCLYKASVAECHVCSRGPFFCQENLNCTTTGHTPCMCDKWSTAT